MKPIDNFYHEKEEPLQSCLLALRSIILDYNPDFEPLWKYRLPCFMYGKHIFCYLWVDRKLKMPYIAIGKGIHLDHPDIVKGERKFTGLLYIDPNKDIPLKKIRTIFDMAMGLYK